MPVGVQCRVPPLRPPPVAANAPLLSAGGGRKMRRQAALLVPLPCQSAMLASGRGVAVCHAWVQERSHAVCSASVRAYVCDRVCVCVCVCLCACVYQAPHSAPVCACCLVRSPRAHVRVCTLCKRAAAASLTLNVHDYALPVHACARAALSVRACPLCQSMPSVLEHALCVKECLLCQSMPSVSEHAFCVRACLLCQSMPSVSEHAFCVRACPERIDAARSFRLGATPPVALADLSRSDGQLAHCVRAYNCMSVSYTP